MSERHLAKSYSSLKQWKHDNGRTEKWTEWDFAVSKEKWLEANKLSEQWLYENLEWMIQEGKIASVQKANEDKLYYIVTTQKGEEFYLIFKRIRSSRMEELVLIFEEHWQCYEYICELLIFSYEVYDYFQNGIKDILFGRFQNHYQNKDPVLVETTVGKIYINFSINHNHNHLPVWKIVSDYRSLLKEIIHNLDNIVLFNGESYIDKVVKIANLFRKCKGKEITRFKVEIGQEEWIDVDSSGISIKLQLCNSGRYVICHKDGSIERGKYFGPYDRGYRIENGFIVDSTCNKIVTDKKLARTIISDIREAKKLFHHIKQEFWRD